MATIQEMLQGKGVTLITSVLPKGNNGEKTEAEKSVPNPAPVPVQVEPTAYAFKRPTINKIVSTVPPAEVRIAIKKDIAEFRNDAEREIPDYVKRIFEAARTPETDEFFGRLQEDRRKLEAEIERLLTLDPEYRNVTIHVYADSLAHTASPGDETKEVFLRLKKIGFISRAQWSREEKIPVGHVRFDGAEYELCPQFAKLPEAQMTIGILRRLASTNYKIEKEQKADKLVLLGREVAKNPMSVANLKNGEKDGRILLFIPSRPTEKKRYPAGHVAFEVRMQKIRVLGAVGDLEETANQIKDAGIFLYASMIFSGSDLGSVKISSENLWMLKTLRAWLIMGINHVQDEERTQREIAERKAKIDAERELLASKTTIAIEKILGRGNVGTAHLNWSEFSSNSFVLVRTDGEEIPVPDLFFNFKRARDGQMSVTACPAWLETILGPHKEPKDPGLKFRDLGDFGAILQAAFGKLVSMGRIDPTQSTKTAKKAVKPAPAEETSVNAN